MGKEDAKKAISSLVETFKRYESEGKLAGLNESNTKAAFIEPLFEALGWNVRDLEEVSRERQVLRGRADYAFRISDVTRFFVEAKAAGVALEEKEAWQAINYAYMKSVPWAVLTNFRELVVYNADWKAKRSEDSQFLRFSCSDYVQRFEDLWLIGKESVSSGALDRKAETYGKKAAREPVSRALYQDLMRWRSLLSKSVARNDPRKKLSKEQVDEGVQRFLNRLIFIRTCEDRKIENERLREALRTWSSDGKRRLISHIRDIFDDFNELYDSDIFAPHMAGNLLIDDSELEKVVSGLYESQDGVYYDFDAIDADVLGNIYEQYLATVMREGGGMLEREGKRKEMGIYYTPTYIVDYIVKNTLGELASGARDGSELERIKVLDPACGSGSFLIRAFEVLRDAYEKKNGGDHEMLGENVTHNAYTILTKNLHGVDLDPKAVEIAELNLLLRAARRKGLLPPLSDNIKRGNSLISGTPEEMERHFGKHWRDKHPFNWEEQFAGVMGEGGFDVVMGNPPYLNVKRGFFQDEQNFLETKFETAKGQYDLYRLFIERGLQLLKDGGYLGFIIPRRSFTNENEIYLRKYLLDKSNIRVIVDVGTAFEDASVEAGILIVQKGTPKSNNRIKRDRIDKQTKKIESIEPILQNTIQDNRNLTFNVQISTQFEKIINKINGTVLGNIANITRGVEAGKSSEFITTKPTNWLLMFGEDVTRYKIAQIDKWIKFSLKDTSTFKPENLYRQKKKIVIRRVADSIISAIDTQQCVTLNTLYCLELKNNISLEFLCGLLNSKLLNFWFKNTFVLTEKLFPYVRISQLNQIPIHIASPSEQEPIIRLVERMLALNRQLAEMGDAKTAERARLEEEIARTDARIDDAVYALYGITGEERETIEQSFGKKG